MIKIVTIVGARPQFIKAAAVSRAIQHFKSESISEVIVHTGQHYDENMSDVFFNELGIPQPKYNLAISGGSHGSMTGRMLEGIEGVFQKEKPDLVLIYGDTNSTLAGALAASKLHIPIAHVEAGLRSFNMRMPEEINRILSDRVSSILFCPTDTAVNNLKAEGITKGVNNVGDVMYDVALHYRDKAREQSDILNKLGLVGKPYVLATCHRAENTDDPKRLHGIMQALSIIAEKVPIVFPIHPRTHKLISDQCLTHYLDRLIILNPLSFLDMVALEQAAKTILTDSGGVQKEAFFYNVPCITMRDETEWVETVHLGWNRLVGASSTAIVNGINQTMESSFSTQTSAPYGDGKAAEKIVIQICNEFTNGK
jgi:UDP-GlcNAc3NAcA epimerase